MKMMLRGELKAELPVLCAPTGARCDELVLSAKDVDQLAEALSSPDERHRKLAAEALSDLRCYFVPDSRDC